MRTIEDDLGGKKSVVVRMGSVGLGWIQMGAGGLRTEGRSNLFFGSDRFRLARIASVCLGTGSGGDHEEDDL